MESIDAQQRELELLYEQVDLVVPMAYKYFPRELHQRLSELVYERAAENLPDQVSLEVAAELTSRYEEVLDRRYDDKNPETYNPNLQASIKNMQDKLSEPGVEPIWRIMREAATTAAADLISEVPAAIDSISN